MQCSFRQWVTQRRKNKIAKRAHSVKATKLSNVDENAIFFFDNKCYFKIAWFMGVRLNEVVFCCFMIETYHRKENISAVRLL